VFNDTYHLIITTQARQPVVLIPPAAACCPGTSCWAACRPGTSASGWAASRCPGTILPGCLLHQHLPPGCLPSWHLQPRCQLSWHLRLGSQLNRYTSGQAAYCPGDWSSKLQTETGTSTMEAEIIALGSGPAGLPAIVPIPPSPVGQPIVWTP
jgi:hypothetical protein